MGKELNVYTCVDFIGFYPVGSAAVVVAKDEDEAEKALKKALKERGLDNDTENLTMVYLPLTKKARAVILVDGDY